MKIKLFGVLMALVLAFSLCLVMAAPAAAATITVDDSGGADFNTIQEAVNAAGPGDTINVAAGTYNENVGITTGKDGLQIVGHSNTDTFITASVTAFDCSSQVTIKGFDISALYYGIVIRSTTGSSVISGNNISDASNLGVWAFGPVTITENDISGCSLGIQTQDSAGGSTISGNTISNITNEGINAFVPTTITDNDISARWGIRIQPGAAGSTISGNTITSTFYESIWAYELATISGNNIVSAPYVGIQITGNAGGSTIDDNTISLIPDSNGYVYQGIWALAPATITNNDISGAGWGIEIRDHSAGTFVDSNNIHNNVYDGIDIPNFDGETPVTSATITNNSFTNNGSDGIELGGGADTSGIAIHHNNFVGNGTFGVESVVTGSEVNATCNWWDDASGPSGEGPGTGDAVSNNVIFAPWLIGPAPDGLCLGGKTPKEIKADAQEELDAIYPTGDKKVDLSLKLAMGFLDKSLADNLWEDDTNLDAKRGENVFTEEKNAVVMLLVLIKDKKTPDGIKPELQKVIEKLVVADRLLAEAAIEENSPGGKFISKALDEMNKAADALAKGNPVVAIEHYQNAWKFAQMGALPWHGPFRLPKFWIWRYFH